MAAKLACNYSRVLGRLLEAGAVKVDHVNLTRLDVVDHELTQVLPHAPALLHMLDRAGKPIAFWNTFDWESFDRAVTKAGAPHTGFHLDLRQEDWPEVVSLRYQSRLQTAAMIDHICESFKLAMRFLKVPVLFENVPYDGLDGAVRLAAEPAAMWQLVDLGVGMLLDVAHLRCTAYHLGVDVYAYAQSLPLKAVRELHVSGPGMVDDQGLQDLHDVLSDTDYKIIQWILARTDPEVVTLEFGGTDPKFGPDRIDMESELIEQLGRLREILHG